MQRRIEAFPDSPNWVAARRGCLTASRMSDAMSFLKRGDRKGDSSEARMNYLRDVVAERLTGIAVDHYVTTAMEWGRLMEARAREEYEIATGRMVDPAGFVLHPRIEFFGATPDNFVDEGIIEYKCPQTRNFLAWIAGGIAPEEHKPQMIAECVCVPCDWVDFAAFHPDMPKGRRLFIRRFAPTKNERDAVESAAQQFLDEVEEMFDKVSIAEFS
jgi:hypothetical protein